MKRIPKKIKSIFKEIVVIAKKQEMKFLPGNLTFSLMLSLIPIAVLFTIIASMFSLSIDGVITFVTDSLPEDVGEIILPHVQNHFDKALGFDWNLGLFMIFGFILASNGADSILIASSALYKTEETSYLKRKIKAILITLIIILLLLFILLIIGFGNFIIKGVLSLTYLDALKESIYNVYLLLKWPISFFLVFTLVKVIYTVSSSRKISSKYVTIGSVFTTLGWILVTSIYSYYAAEFARYDLFYGGLANIIVMMIYLYLLSYILVLGIAINASNYEVATGILKIEE